MSRAAAQAQEHTYRSSHLPARAPMKNTPPNKYRYLRYGSILVHKVFRDYSRHNLPLLLQMLSYQLSLFRSSTVFKTKYDFFQLRRQINQTTTKFQAYFDTFETQKSTGYLSLKTDMLIPKFTRPFYAEACGAEADD